MKTTDVIEAAPEDVLEERASADLLRVYSHSVLWGAPMKVQEFIEHEESVNPA